MFLTFRVVLLNRKYCTNTSTERPLKPRPLVTVKAHRVPTCGISALYSNTENTGLAMTRTIVWKQIHYKLKVSFGIMHRALHSKALTPNLEGPIN